MAPIWRAITWVSNYGYPIWTFSFNLNFKRGSTLSNKFRNLLWRQLISTWTSCRTIQGVIALVFWNRPRASRSHDFEITCAITPWTVLYSVQLLLINLDSASVEDTENQLLRLSITFKAQPTNTFFATVSQMFGDSSQLPTPAERAVIKSLSTSETTKSVLGSSRKLEGAGEHLIDGNEKRICRLSFEF